jgi:hypothetical protein
VSEIQDDKIAVSVHVLYVRLAFVTIGEVCYRYFFYNIELLSEKI